MPDGGGADMDEMDEMDGWMDGWMKKKEDGVKRISVVVVGRQVVRSSMLSHRFGALEGYKWDDERGEAAASKQVLRSGD